MSNRNLTTIFKALSATCLLAIASVSQAAITPFADNFESYGTAGVPSVTLFNPPWPGFSDNCGFPGGYSFDPSTTGGVNGAQMTALAYDGVDNQYLNFFANYENAPCHTGVGPNSQEEIFVYREMVYDGTDTANSDTWVFTFDYREADVPPGGATEVYAYIRVFDGASNILFETTLDTSGPTDWETGRLAVTLDPIWVNGVIQVGIANLTGNYEGSGVFYDNMNFARVDDNILIRTVGFGDVIHPNHDGRDPNPSTPGGMNPDDVIAVVLYGESTSAGDPENLITDNVDIETLRIGQDEGRAGGIDPALAQSFNLDVDADGIEDARFRFRTSDSEFQCSDSSGTLTGELTTGETFAGTDGFTAQCNVGCH